MPDPIGPIQIIPPGLLGYLQLKNAGENPHLLLQEIRPTIELRDWYFQARMEDFAQAVGPLTQNVVTGTGSGVQNWAGVASVPQSEIWWLENFTIQATFPLAADTVEFNHVYSTPPLGTQNPYALSESALFVGAAGQVRRGQHRCGGFFIPPGAILGFNIVQVTSALGIAMTGFVRFCRLKL